MNLVELQRALRQLRLSGLADSLETRLLQAQSEKLAPLDFLSILVQDEPVRRQDRLLERRLKQQAEAAARTSRLRSTEPATTTPSAPPATPPSPASATTTSTDTSAN